MIARFLTAALISCLIILSGVSPSHATIFMLADGIKGEVVDAAHKDWSEILSVAWGHGEPPPGVSVAVQFERLTIVKEHDATSALFAQRAADGRPFREIKIEIAFPFDNKFVATSRVKLTGARITHYSTGAQGNNTGPVPTDSISFSFETITWIDFNVSPNGQQSPGSAACFDLRKNASCVPTF